MTVILVDSMNFILVEKYLLLHSVLYLILTGENDFTAIVNQNVGQFSNVQRQQCFFVKITNDMIPESLETFFLNITNGEEVLEQLTIRPAVAEVTIRDTDREYSNHISSKVNNTIAHSLITMQYHPQWFAD